MIRSAVNGHLRLICVAISSLVVTSGASAQLNVRINCTASHGCDADRCLSLADGAHAITKTGQLKISSGESLTFLPDEPICLRLADSGVSPEVLLLFHVAVESNLLLSEIPVEEQVRVNGRITAVKAESRDAHYVLQIDDVRGIGVITETQTEEAR